MKKYIKWFIPISIIGMLLADCQMNSESKSQVLILVKHRMLLAGCQMNSESKSQLNEVKNSKQSAVKKDKK